MADDHKTPKGDTDKNPAHQTRPDAGQIKGPQRTGATMNKPDLPRGTEPENRGRSSGR